MTRNAHAIAPPELEYEVISLNDLAQFNVKFNNMVMDSWEVDGDITIIKNEVCTMYAQRMKRAKNY